MMEAQHSFFEACSSLSKLLYELGALKKENKPAESADVVRKVQTALPAFINTFLTVERGLYFIFPLVLLLNLVFQLTSRTSSSSSTWSAASLLQIRASSSPQT